MSRGLGHQHEARRLKPSLRLIDHTSWRGGRRVNARMGHDSERAAMIYQHEARGADQLITNAIDAHVQGEQSKDDADEEDGSAGILVPAG